MSSVSIEDAPERLQECYKVLFSPDFLKFLEEIVIKFDHEIEQILIERERRKLEIKDGKWKPEFTNKFKDSNWTINELPKRLINRKLDLGDVSPSNTQHLIDALYSDVQGIQIDFDDGFCPTWRNVILGHYNILMTIHNKLHGAPENISKIPLLMLRPRAFNMIEHHCIVNGKEVNGALFDFALLMFHNGNELTDLEIGPFFYLSKIESMNETKLWNDMFIYVQDKLKIRRGTIKACVLIENILAAYSMDDILYSIREHSIGLNCGIWDYCASIISKFGDNPDILMPDRSKYVNMSQPFLLKYMKLVISTCHRRNALATAGMSSQLLPKTDSIKECQEIVNAVKNAKMIEILEGVDGFMVYDTRLVPDMLDLWKKLCPLENQISKIPDTSDILPINLIQIPKHDVTINGLRHNIYVSLLFIYHWLTGCGVFYFKNAVEDSATAEISRSQLWQWIRHSASMEDGNQRKVTRILIYEELEIIIQNLLRSLCKTQSDRKRLISSKYILLEIITARNFIEFLTTFLNDNHKFRSLHNKSDGLHSKL